MASAAHDVEVGPRPRLLAEKPAATQRCRARRPIPAASKARASVRGQRRIGKDGAPAPLARRTPRRATRSARARSSAVPGRDLLHRQSGLEPRRRPRTGWCSYMTKARRPTGASSGRPVPLHATIRDTASARGSPPRDDGVTPLRHPLVERPAPPSERGAVSSRHVLGPQTERTQGRRPRPMHRLIARPEPPRLASRSSRPRPPPRRRRARARRRASCRPRPSREPRCHAPA